MGNGRSKEAFRNVLQQLNEREVSPSDTALWEKLWTTESTPHDVFEVITPATVRQLRAERLGNVRALLTTAVAQLEKVAADPDPASKQVADVDELIPGVMTAVRVLTRVLPFLLEDYRNNETGEVDPDLERLFWASEAPVFSEKTESDADGGSPAGAAAEEGEATEGVKGETGAPLGAAIVSVAMRLLFTRQLAVDSFSTTDPQAAARRQADANGVEESSLGDVRDSSLLWSQGLVAARPATIHGGRYLESNRVEIMRLLLVLLCEPLFQGNTNFDSTSSRFAGEACRAGAPFAAELFFSLISVIITYDPVGWGVPYAGSFTSDIPIRQLDIAAQLLVVLLDHGKPPLPVVTSPAVPDGTFEVEASRAVREDPPAPDTLGYNVFRNLVLHGLKEEEDFKAIFNGLSRLLNNLHRSRSAYMPSSSTTVNCHQEVLVLVWKLMEENPLLMQYVLKHCDLNEILVPICFLLVENRKDLSKGGLIHICTFILLKLSGERLFGVAINKPCSVRLPTDLPLFTGSHLDLLILTLHKMLVAGSERLSTLYHCFLTVLCNVSPYCKCMSLVASVKLLNLFELFTSARNLYASETNQMYVSLLLEMFSNIIQYQYGGNAHLIYAIVRRKEVFEKLYELDLPTALAAAQAYAKSGIAAKRAKEAAEEETAARAQGVGREAAEPAMGLKAGPEDEGEGVSASEAVLQQSSGPARSDPGVEKPEAADPNVPVTLRFHPTQEWLDKLRSEIPFNTIMRLLQNLGPQVEDMCTNAGTLSESTMVEFVTNTTMVGLLPVPHPIVIRKYHPNQHTAIWFTAFMWGVVFVRNQELPMFDAKRIKLFTISTS